MFYIMLSYQPGQTTYTGNQRLSSQSTPADVPLHKMKVLGSAGRLANVGISLTAQPQEPIRSSWLPSVGRLQQCPSSPHWCCQRHVPMLANINRLEDNTPTEWSFVIYSLSLLYFYCKLFKPFIRASWCWAECSSAHWFFFLPSNRFLLPWITVTHRVI